MGEEEKEKKGGDDNKEIVVKVDMHCQACSRRVARSLLRLPGVEEVKTDIKASRVVVRGKEAEPLKVFETLVNKCGRTVQLLSPPLPPTPQHPSSPPPPPPPPVQPPPPPPVVTVVLSVRMHCEACAQVLQKRIRKIKGVESVETNVSSDEVTVRGTVEASQLVSDVYKKTRKHAVIVNKEVDAKKDEKNEEKKKEEEEDDKKERGDDENKGNEDIKRIEHLPSKYFTDYAYAPQIFSDENPNACSLM